MAIEGKIPGTNLEAQSVTNDEYPSITLDGWDEEDVASLLEETAKFLRSHPDATDDKQVLFKQVDTGDLFTLVNRS